MVKYPNLYCKKFSFCFFVPQITMCKRARKRKQIVKHKARTKWRSRLNSNCDKSVRKYKPFFMLGIYHISFLPKFCPPSLQLNIESLLTLLCRIPVIKKNLELAKRYSIYNSLKQHIRTHRIGQKQLTVTSFMTQLIGYTRIPAKEKRKYTTEPKHQQICLAAAPLSCSEHVCSLQCASWVFSSVSKRLASPHIGLLSH